MLIHVINSMTFSRSRFPRAGLGGDGSGDLTGASPVSIMVAAQCISSAR